MNDFYKKVTKIGNKLHILASKCSINPVLSKLSQSFTYKKLMKISTINIISTMSSIILSGSFGQLKYEHVSVSSKTKAAEKGVKIAVYMTKINITQSHTA